MQKFQIIVAMCALLSSTATLSQSGPPPGMARISGAITAVDGNTVTVNSVEAASVDLRVTHATRIMFRKKTTAASINGESYIGCAAVEQEDGTLVASECHIFPEQMRGSGEGHRPMGAPATTMTNGSVTTMTNGTVEGEVESATNIELTIGYQGGAKSIQITPQTEVTQIVAAGQDALVPGAKVSGAVRQSDDGGADIVFINIEN